AHRPGKGQRAALSAAAQGGGAGYRGAGPGAFAAGTAGAQRRPGEHRLRAGRKRVDPGDSADPEAARVQAIALLARRDFASGELRRRLTERGFAAEAAAAAVAALTEERRSEEHTSEL